MEIFTYPFASLFYFSLLGLVLYADNRSFLNNLLNNKLLRNIGIISYGLYIYHGILLPTFERIFPRMKLIGLFHDPFVGILLFFLLAIGSTYVIAFLSWHIFERQILKLKKCFDYKRETSAPVSLTS